MNEPINSTLSFGINYLLFIIFIFLISLFSIFIKRYVYKLGNYLSKTDEPIWKKILKSYIAYIIIGLPLTIILLHKLIQDFPDKDTEVLLKNAIVIASVILVSIRILANPSYYLNKNLDWDSANRDKGMFLGLLYGFFFSSLLLISISKFIQLLNIGSYSVTLSRSSLTLLVSSTTFYFSFLFLGSITGEFILHWLNPIVSPGLLRTKNETEAIKNGDKTPMKLRIFEFIPKFDNIRLEKLFESLSLDKDQKLKLIELLLIIGTLSATFNLAKDWIWLYMLFALTSIIYFIIIQKDFQNKIFIYIIAIFISTIFSGIITGNLFVTIVKDPHVPPFIYLILFIIYYIVFSVIIFLALKK